MNFIKSAFISLFVVFCVIAMVYSVFQLLNSTGLVWWVVFLMNSSVVLFFAHVFISKPGNTSTSQFVITMLMLTGMLIVIGDKVYNGTEGTSFIWLGILSAVGWLLYDNWYSKLRASVNAGKAGQSLPLFSLMNEKGEMINSEAFAGNYNLWLFHRGHWCPICHAQAKKLASEWRALEDKGVKIHIIGPQKARGLKKELEKMQMPYQVWIDRDFSASRALDLYHRFSLPMGLQIFGLKTHGILPTVIITDESNTIVYFSKTDDYRNRPEPSTFLPYLQKRGSL